MMHSSRLRILAAVTAVFFVAGCASVGLGRSGNKFNYENASKLKKGMGKAKVEELLEGKPSSTGRQMHTGYEHWHYQYVQTTGLGASIPGMGASQGGGQGYNCDVYFNDAGKLVDFNYFTNELGSQGVSF